MWRIGMEALLLLSHTSQVTTAGADALYNEGWDELLNFIGG